MIMTKNHSYVTKELSNLILPCPSTLLHKAMEYLQSNYKVSIDNTCIQYKNISLLTEHFSLMKVMINPIIIFKILMELILDFQITIKTVIFNIEN